MSVRLTRRRLIGVAAGAAAGAALRARALAQAPAGRLHAMVVAIDTYSGVPRLRGALNDGRVIADALRPLAASLRTLRDGEATREAFLARWNEMVAQAAPGDTLLLTYSGHGGREQRRGAPAALGTRNGTLIMSPFDARRTPLNTQRLFDDEVNGLFVEPGRRGMRVIFVVDACHSGTMTRSADPRVAGITYRTIGNYELDDAAVVAAPPPRQAAPAELRHVVYLAAGQESELVPEVQIDGTIHGAMSWSFARALAGAADESGDGRITWGALSRYVLRNVRTHADAQQHPDLRTAGRAEDVLFTRGVAAPQAPTASLQAPPGDAARVRVHMLNVDAGERAALLAILPDAQAASAANAADVIWDAGARQALNPLGNVVAYDVGRAELPGVVGRFAALAVARRLTAASGLDTRLLLPGESAAARPSQESDRTHVAGARLTFVASGFRYPHLVLVNVAGNGTVQFLYPRMRDPVAIDAARPYELPLQVATPFGADYLIAIASERPLPELVADLTRLDNRPDARALATALETRLRGARVQVGVQGIFTTPRSGG